MPDLAPDETPEPVPDEKSDHNFGGDYARDTHRGGLGDDYARDGGWSGGGRADTYTRDVHPESDAPSESKETDINKASE
jgi:hypothetical protein